MQTARQSGNTSVSLGRPASRPRRFPRNLGDVGVEEAAIQAIVL